MLQRDPETIRQELLSILEVLQKAEDVIQTNEQQKMAEKLSEVYSYVSEQVEKPGGANFLRRQAASNAKQADLQAAERKEMSQQKEFIEKNFDNAEKHFKTFQLAGYAVFFAVWGFTQEWIPKFAAALAVLPMMFSASIFVLWEIVKTSILASMLRKNALINTDNISKFLIDRSSHLDSKNGAILFFSRARLLIWWLCIIPAFFALAIMFINIILYIIN